MPGHDGFWFHNDQGLGPTSPQLAERNPKQPIEAVQFGTRLFPLQNSELLTKSSGLQSKFVARHEQGPDVGDHRVSERNHQSDLTQSKASPGLLIPCATAWLFWQTAFW